MTAEHVVTSTRRPLTTQEGNILGLVAEGMSNKAIGARLFISEDTVKTHLRRMMRKLGVNDRAHAVHIGHLTGLLGSVRSGLAAPVPRTDLSDRHRADCALFHIRYCDCRDRLSHTRKASS